jgi:WhiB family redox-sensing transcriptional regulator
MRTHGKISTYANGCRCEDCRRASREASRKRRRAARQQPCRALAHVDVDWTAAACAGLDPDPFHPRRGENAAAAKTICRACPIQADCLAWALANHERHGIWGGRSERERRRLLQETSL